MPQRGNPLEGFEPREPWKCTHSLVVPVGGRTPDGKIIVICVHCESLLERTPPKGFER